MRFLRRLFATRWKRRAWKRLRLALTEIYERDCARLSELGAKGAHGGWRWE